MDFEQKYQKDPGMNRVNGYQDDDNDNIMTGLDVGNVIMILISQAHCFQKMFKPYPYPANSHNLR